MKGPGGWKGLEGRAWLVYSCLLPTSAADGEMYNRGVMPPARTLVATVAALPLQRPGPVHWRRRASPSVRLLGAALLVLGWSLGLAWSAPTEQAKPRGDHKGPQVLLVGIDAADWDLIDPLSQRGELPHLTRLRAQAAWAVLQSDSPTLSPLLWTTAVTGRPPDEHGVLDFFMSDSSSGALVPISSHFRKVRALWNILTEAGMSVGVVAWWATWPAEPVEGVLVSDRVAYSMVDYLQRGGSHGATYPASYLERVESLRVTAGELEMEQLRPFVRITQEEFDRSNSVLAKGGNAAYTEPISSLRHTLAGALTYHRITLDLLRKGQPRWMAVYYQGLDEVNHRFAHMAPPEHPLAGADDARRYGAVVEEFYRFQDRLLGELLEEIAPGTYVMILSDHGFANGSERPTDSPPFVEDLRARWHRPEGMWMLHGPGVQAGPLEAPVRLNQITPTILRLLDLPLARDMKGQPIEEALAATFLADHPARWIDTYETTPRTPPSPLAAGGQADQEMMARLRSLGYLSDDEAMTAGGEPGVGTATANYHANLGTVLLERGDLQGARSAFQRAVEIAPGHYVAQGALIHLHLRSGRLDLALKAARTLMTAGQRFDPEVYAMAAQLFLHTDRVREGEQVFRELSQSHGSVPMIHIGLALLLRAGGDLEGAQTVYGRALDLDPDSTLALQGLGSLLVGMDRATEAIPFLRRALEQDPDLLEARTDLVVALGRVGQPDEALRIFRASDVEGQAPLSLVNAMALAHHANSANREARTLLMRSLALDPSQPKVRALLETLQNAPAPEGDGGAN